MNQAQKNIMWIGQYGLSAQLGPVDLGLSHFSGTSRVPELQPRFSVADGLELIPFYGLIDQTGLDLQTIIGNWTWKLESIVQSKKRS